MMRKNGFLRFFAGLLACLLLLPGAAAFAEGVGVPEPEEDGLLDPDALQAILDQFMEERHLENTDWRSISIGFCYTETGETWVSNPDHWYYSASLYKVPLMMLLAQREYNGEITQESKLKGGVTLATAEDYVLVYSNNEYGHLMMAEMGGEPESRQQYRQFSTLPEDYYVDDFYTYSFFTCQFMTDVMKTLYYNQEHFPHILDCLQRAQHEHYFHAVWGGKYPVAQKYGAYTSPYNGYEYNHTAAVVYTEHPFILVVMTQNMGIGEGYLQDLARLYGEYSLSLDEPFAAWQAAREAAAATPEPEEPQQPQGAEETDPAEPPAGETEPEATPAVTPAPAEPGDAPKLPTPVLAALAVLGLALVGVVLSAVLRPRRKVSAGRHVRRR